MSPAYDRRIAPQIITRRQALAEGATRYFTGKPCIHGHIAERYVTSYNCMECAAMRDTFSRQIGYSQRGSKVLTRGEGRISEREEFRRAFLEYRREAVDDDA